MGIPSRGRSISRGLRVRNSRQCLGNGKQLCTFVIRQGMGGDEAGQMGKARLGGHGATLN